MRRPLHEYLDEIEPTADQQTLALIGKLREFIDTLSPCERCQLGTDWDKLHSIEVPPEPMDCQHNFCDADGNRVYLMCTRGCGARDPLESSPPVPQQPPRLAESKSMTKPNAQQIAEMLVKAFRTQVAGAAEGQAIIAAGLGKQLDELIVSTAANVAQPIMWAFEPVED